MGNYLVEKSFESYSREVAIDQHSLTTSRKLLTELVLEGAALDPGITTIVQTLMENGIETFESCEGGPGHAFYEPTVRFHGNQSEGFKAFAIAQTLGLRPLDLRRYWQVQDGELVGPQWEMTFRTDEGEGRWRAHNARVRYCPRCNAEHNNWCPVS